MNFLLIGGAGYIGANVADLLTRKVTKSSNVVVYDNLTTGFRNSLNKDVNFVYGDCQDEEKLIQSMKKFSIDFVIHFAASISISEGNVKPIEYFENNLFGTIKVLSAMRKTGIKKMIFSSTAAVYGNTSGTLLCETTAANPINSYGASKFACEKLINFCKQAYNIDCVILRYFNVAGAGGTDAQLGVWNLKSQLLIPKINSAIIHNWPIEVFGNDYSETNDGTGIRDYVHVSDVAQAHLNSVNWLCQNSCTETFNIASGKGYSVLECIGEAEKVLQKKVCVTLSQRRQGEPSILVADISKAKRLLGWEPTRDLSQMIVTDYFFRKNTLPKLRENTEDC